MVGSLLTAAILAVFAAAFWFHHREFVAFQAGLGSGIPPHTIERFETSHGPGTRTTYCRYKLEAATVKPAEWQCGPLPPSARDIVEQVSQRLLIRSEELPDVEETTLLYAPAHAWPQSYLFVHDETRGLAWVFDSD